MSTGWVLGVVAIHNWQLALFDPRAQPMCDDDNTLISSYMPVGKVTRVDGGFRPSGRQPRAARSTASGLFGAMVPPAAAGSPDFRTFPLPRDYTIVDNWNVSGLAAPAATISVDNASCRIARTARSTASTQFPATRSTPAFRIPFGQIRARGVLGRSARCGRWMPAQVNRDRYGLADANASRSTRAQEAAADATRVVDSEAGHVPQFRSHAGAARRLAVADRGASDARSIPGRTEVCRAGSTGCPVLGARASIAITRECCLARHQCRAQPRGQERRQVRAHQLLPVRAPNEDFPVNP
jgi:hypothetical protein